MFILPERQSFGETIGSSLGAGLTQSLQSMLKNKLAQRSMNAENQALQRFGIDVAGIGDPDLRKQIVAESLKGQSEFGNKAMAGQNALSTINRMRQLGSQGNLGFGSGVQSTVFGGKTARDYGEYEQLGKSLIQMASPIIIRNKSEFETLAGKLYDPSIRDQEREGILAGMEKIIKDNMGYSMQEQPAKASISDFKKEHDGSYLVRNKNGETGRVPADKIQQAIEMGYTPQ